jgi:predicted  nucleic acid-binding Zn-ribbon protein
MVGPAETLREIHRLRRHAKNLQDEVERLPRLLKAQQAKVTRAEEAVREAQETLKKLKVATHEKEVSLKGNQQLIAKHEKQRNEATSKKEYDALQAEIAVEKNKCQKIEEEILKSMIAADDYAGKLPELEAALKRAKAECAEFEGAAAERQATMTEQLNKALAELKDIEVHLPGDVQPLYTRLVASRGEDGMSAVHNRTCQACYTEITAQMYNDLLTGRFILCKSCGRLLYLPE